MTEDELVVVGLRVGLWEGPGLKHRDLVREVVEPI